MPKSNTDDERTVPLTDDADQPRDPNDHREFPAVALAEPGSRDQEDEPRADDLALESKARAEQFGDDSPAPPAPEPILAEHQSMTLEEFMATHYGDYGQTLMGGWVNWRRSQGLLSDKEDVLMRSFKAYINRPAG